MSTTYTWKGYATAFMAGIAGALLFYWLHMPLPWMLGSLFGALVASNVPGIYGHTPGCGCVGLYTGWSGRNEYHRLDGRYGGALYCAAPYSTHVFGYDRRTAPVCKATGYRRHAGQGVSGEIR